MTGSTGAPVRSQVGVQSCDHAAPGAAAAIERIDWRCADLPLHGLASTRAIEAAALAASPPNALMASAGAAVARLALAIAPHGRDVVVVAGPGHNGGDGLEAAARLQAAGRRVRVLRPGDAEAAAAAVSAGAADPANAAGEGIPALVIDALLGIGASRPPLGDFAAAIERIAAWRAAGAVVLAIDVPSGLDADRGQPLGAACVAADHTLTLLTLKPGLFGGAGRDHAGDVWHCSLGVGCDGRPADARLLGAGSLRRELRPASSHKGRFGDVAIVAGGAGMAGAAWLAGRAALAAGAGRVFVDPLAAGAAVPFDPRHPEMMVRPGWWRGPREALSRSTVVCGCGGGDAVREALPALLGNVPRLVLDADALNAIAADPALAAQLAARAGRGQETVLTPHPLEAARLLGCSTAEVQADRLAAATRLAAMHRAVVVLKGSGSMIAEPGGGLAICASGNASLATAGTGDVLAGWIGGRWPDGARAGEVARQAVVEHGAASEPPRPGALRASDLIDRLYALSRRPAPSSS